MSRISPIIIPVSLKIVTPVLEVEKMMLKGVRDIFNKRLPAVAKAVEKDIQQNISAVFVQSREYESLLLGPLNAHFGFPKGSEANRLDEIIFTLAKSIRVTHVRVAVRGRKLTGGLRIEMFKGDFADILSLTSAFVHTAKGETLPWLDWMLLKGDQIIITDYVIDFGKHPLSRSGEAIMKEKTGGIWKVPPGVSGTITKNWITRAVDESLNFIIKLTTASVNRHLDRIL